MEITSENLLLEIFRNRSEMEAQLTNKETGEVINRIPVQWKSRSEEHTSELQSR